MTYDPKAYWEQRLGEHFDLRGVGHIGFTPRYNRWLYRRKAQVLARVWRDRPLGRCAVLDVGCGTGFFVAWYLKRGAEVYGLDITEVSIRELRRRFPGSTFAVVDISDAGYRAARAFDVVNAWDVLYHITDDVAFSQALANIGHSLALDGTLLVTDCLAAPTDTQVAPHVHFRSVAAYRPLADFGLTLVRLHPLYHRLNREGANPRMAPLSFALDTLLNHLAPDNLCLGVWQRPPLEHH